MKLLAFLLFALFPIACQKESRFTPKTMVGQTLKGTVTSATGVFAGLEGYQFSTLFTSESIFETRNAAGSLESEGIYGFSKNKLTLQSEGGLHVGEGVEIKLKFTDAKSGVYEAKSLSGAAGEQTGIFTLQ
jgi:hypothetical protein